MGQPQQSHGRSSPGEDGPAVPVVTDDVLAALHGEIGQIRDQRAYRTISALIAARRSAIVHTHMAKGGAGRR